jgi:prolyl-tRNA synthetase
MKDSYSFDVDDAGLDRAYAAHREAYIRIFDRLGLEYVIVSAMSGAMGGSKSEEFLTPTPVGEDTFVRSPGGYAANVEAVRTVAPEAVPFDGLAAAHVEDTPDTPTIDTLVEVAQKLFPDEGYTAASTLKNVVLTLVHPDGTREPVVIGLPGDREVDDKRLEAQVAPAEVEPFTAFDAHPELVKGYIGPQVLGADSASGIRYLVDPRVVPGTRWITGANEPGKHVFDLVAGRDFSWDGVVEAAEVKAGDPAPDGSGPLQLARGVEMGHIFQLGRKYADALDLKVLDENGKLVTVTMGSYGIGVSRAVAAIAESTHDELGLCWPRGIAPADVHVVATGKDPAVFEAAERLSRELVDAGLTVLYDDRPKVSPGVKFKDAELLGMPTIVTVGRGLAEGTVELRDRATGEREEVPVEGAAQRITAAARG